jgi:transposase
VLSLCRGLLDHFGGLPEQVLFDNMKAGVIERMRTGRLHRWNDEL